MRGPSAQRSQPEKPQRAKRYLTVLSTEENETKGLGRCKPQYASFANSKHASIEQRARDSKLAQQACEGLSRFDGGPVPQRR